MDMEEKQFVAVLQKITKSNGFVVEIKSYGFYDAEKEVGVERSKYEMILLKMREQNLIVIENLKQSMDLNTGHPDYSRTYIYATDKGVNYLSQYSSNFLKNSNKKIN